MHHQARKRFGQHFLTDQNVIQHIVAAINPVLNQHLVEIGPGLGALTVPILKKVGELDVIEFDRDIIPLLKSHCEHSGTLNIHQANVLDFDFAQLIKAKPLRIIGNLPYNISTPLIFHLLHYAANIEDMHFMLQKEVVDRIAANVGENEYGRLSIMVQYHCEVSALFDVPPSAFEPPPRVDSSIVRLVPYHQLPFKAENYTHFANIVRQAFNHRRKTLRNCLKNMMNLEDWKSVNIDANLRPEQLSVQNYVELSNHVSLRHR